MDNNLETALTKKLCPICLKEQSGDILINSKLTPKAAKEVKELHNKVVGFADSICDECKDVIGDGVYFIIVDESLSEDMNNPHRTGHILGVKKEVINDLCNDEKLGKKIIDSQMTYIDINLAKQIGLIEDYENMDN